MIEHLQINDVAPTASYTADGIQCAFTFPFAIFKATDLEVWLNAALQVSGFAVSGAGVSNGGSVLFAAPPSDGVRVTLRRRMPILRTSDLQANGVILAKTLNDEFDFLTAAIQQVADDVTRTATRPVTSPSSASLDLPDPEPGKALGWNADGTGLTNDPADFAATVAETTAQAATATAQAATATAQTNLAISANTAAQAAQVSAEVAATNAATSAASASASAAAAEVARIEWKGAWSPTNAYTLSDAVAYGGGSWICVQDHTNQIPADNTWWDPLAVKGTDGTGVGDLTAANNLSDVADPATARTNLGAADVAHGHVSSDIGDFTEAAQDVVGAMIAAAGGIYDDGAGSITLPNMTDQDVLDRLSFLEMNLAINSLRDQIDTGWSVLKMVDGIADEFEDTAGIASNTGNYDTAGDFIHNTGATINIQTLVPQMTNDTSPSGQVLASSTYPGYGNYVAFDRNYSNTGWHSNGGSGQWLGYRFTTGQVVNYWRVMGWTDGGHTISLQGSHDGSSWSNIDTRSVTFVSWQWSPQFSNTNSTAYTYYRVYCDAVGGDGWCRFMEIEFGNSQTNPTIDLTAVSVASIAQTVPTETRLVLLHQPLDSVTLNTDVTVEASRDNGTTWTSGTLTNQGAFDTATNILSAIVDLSGQPTGMAMRWRCKTLNTKEQRLHGIWMQWR